MAEAIFSRLLSAQISAPEAIHVREVDPERCQYLQTQYGLRLATSFEALLASVEVLILAIKPQVFTSLASSLTSLQSHPETLVISIMAGTPLAAVEAVTGKSPVIRVMPNTPAMVGAGISAFAPGSYAQEDHQQIAAAIFEAVGEVVQVQESLMDAVTALSGSGPAYVAIAIEALADAGVSVGLPRGVALQLALQTVRGTAELLHCGQMHPALLKDKVTSPGGTTIAGIRALEQHGFRSAIIEAVQCAYRQSQTLGRLSDQPLSDQ